MATHTNALSQTRSEERNALGETVKTTDHEGGAVRFTHDVQGNVTSVAREKPAADTTAAPASVTTAMAYDLLGRMTGMADPDRGAWSYRHNALGELTCRQSAAGHFTVMTYDGLGRMASRKDYRAHAGAGCSTLTGAQSGSLEANAVWTHDTAANGLGQIAEVTDSKSGYRKVHAYDAHGRPDTTATTPGTGNGTHYERTTYDQFGRVFQAFDASRTSSAFTDHGVRHVYNANGHLQALRDAVGAEDAQGTFTPRTTYRTVTAMDARGNVTADRQDRAYEWDVLGNLTRRQWTLDGTARSEAFTYDGLNRFKTHRVPGGALNSVTYDGYGNIRSRTGAGAATRTTTTLYLGGVERITRPDGAVRVRRHIFRTYKAEGGMETSEDSRFEFQVPKGSHLNLYAKIAAVRACGFWCAACSAAGAFPTGFCG